MSATERSLTDFFVILTFVANSITVAVLAGALVAAVSPNARRRLGGALEAVGPVALPVAFAIAAVATAGSLYYSLVVDLTPCVLCWYQRILMYPLVVILGVSWWRRDRGVALLALPFVVLGAGVSTYHFLVERYPSLGEGLECSLEAPCTVPWFTEAGFVTLAYMALSGFLAVGALVGVDAAWNSRVEDDVVGGEPEGESRPSVSSGVSP